MEARICKKESNFLVVIANDDNQIVSILKPVGLGFTPVQTVIDFTGWVVIQTRPVKNHSGEVNKKTPPYWFLSKDRAVNAFTGSVLLNAKCVQKIFKEESFEDKKPQQAIETKEAVKPKRVKKAKPSA
jgi:hypothetical protein